MKAVRVATEPTLAVSAPISMFPGVLPNPANSNPVSRHWDIMPDGSRIVFVKVDAGNRADAELVVVQHWFEELKALVPPIGR